MFARARIPSLFFEGSGYTLDQLLRWHVGLNPSLFKKLPQRFFNYRRS